MGAAAKVVFRCLRVPVKANVPYHLVVKHHEMVCDIKVVHIQAYIKAPTVRVSIELVAVSSVQHHAGTLGLAEYETAIRVRSKMLLMVVARWLKLIAWQKLLMAMETPMSASRIIDFTARIFIGTSQDMRSHIAVCICESY